MLKTVALILVAALSVTTACGAGAQGLQAGMPVPSAGRDAARVDVDVRMMLAAEIRSLSGDSVLPAEAVGLFLVPQALLSPTAADSVTSAMVGPPGTEGFEAPARTVMSLLATTSLPADLAAQIRENMRNAALEAGDVWRFDVALGYYGLRSEDWRPGVQSESASYCLIAAGVVTVTGLHGPIATSTIRRGVDASSDGMPRPECAALKEYAANGGMLLRQATRDMASVLAAWIVNRTMQER
jgi:hypothetical protein